MQINRRDAITLTLAGTVSGATGRFAEGISQQSSHGLSRPNILFIMCDQLNAGLLGCYGGPIPTPNLDRLCRTGVRFTNATCTYPVCSPNRATIITGRYPHAHGIVYNCMGIDYPTVPSPPTEQGITREDNTDGKLLHAAGYDTHQYGKWHLHGDTLPYYPDTYGEHFEYQREMAGVFEQVRKRPRATWMNWYGWALPVAVGPAMREAVQHAAGKWGTYRAVEVVTKAGRGELPLKQLFDVRVTDHAVRRLQALDSDPFMITASLNHPHDPPVVPSPYYEEFQPSNIRLPANSAFREKRFDGDRARLIVRNLGDVGLRELLRIYYASVRLVDDQVGRLLDGLEKTGRAQDTVVVFTTDHGDMAGGHGMFWKGTSAFYDEVVRIPLLISYPKVVKPRVSNLPVSSVDLMPTLLDLAGEKRPAGVQGQSIAPYLLDENHTAGLRRFTFCERVRANPEHTRHIAPGTPASFMVRGEGWKYIRYSDGGEYLYQLAKDPGETTNLASESSHSGERDALRREMQDWLSATGYPEAYARFM